MSALADPEAAGGLAGPPAAPPALRRAARWGRRNLFSSPLSAAVTILFAWLLWLALPAAFDWAVAKASFLGSTRADCAEDGACWTFIRVWLPQLLYGRFPAAERWRIDVAAILLALAFVPVLVSRLRLRGAGIVVLCLVFPPVAAVLVRGGVLGLAPVDPGLIGGLSLNIVLSFAAGAVSLPLGVLLALGRRAKLPLVRWCAIGFIEFWRGVPLVTVLFTALVLLPLFMPPGSGISPLLRAMVALSLFYAAYMAEVVRGGLQALPRGQAEAAHALGLGYWRTHLLVVLPQALRLVIPGLVNTLVELFKDSTLVYVIGLFDVLGVVALALRDLGWVGYSTEGYLFVALVYFLACFALSRYSRGLEQRLRRAQSHG